MSLGRRVGANTVLAAASDHAAFRRRRPGLEAPHQTVSRCRSGSRCGVSPASAAINRPPCHHPPDLRRAALTAVLGLPRARPLPDPVEYATIPLTGFRVSAQPGPAAETEDREAGTTTPACDTRARPLPPGQPSGWRHPVGTHRASRPPTVPSPHQTPFGHILGNT